MHRWAIIRATIALSLMLPPLARAENGFDPPPSARFAQARLDNITAFLEHEIADGKIAGAIYYVHRDGGQAFSAMLGHSNADAARPMSADTIFRLFSLTKPVTSVLALILVDQGRLKLDDPLSRYIPAFGQTMVGVPARDVDGTYRLSLVPQKRAITIRDLLRHTSGIPYGFYGDSLVRKAYARAELYAGDPDNAEFANRIAALPLEVQPGTLWDYGYSTDILGRVIEIVSGRSLEEFAREVLFTPLGMKDTGFDVLASDRRARLAEPVKSDSDFRTAVSFSPDVRYRLQSGGGGLFSTLHDMQQFAQMLLDGGLYKGRRILSAAMYQQLTTDQIGKGSGIARDHYYFPGDGFGFGLGLAVRTDAGHAVPPPPGSIGELKWDSASGCYLGIDRKQRMYVLLLQQAPTRRQHIITNVKRMLYQALEK